MPRNPAAIQLTSPPLFPIFNAASHPVESEIHNASPALLPFQKEILSELITEDSCLVVLASGLGLYPIFSFFLQLFAKPTCLVLLLNLDIDVANLPNSVNKDHVHVIDNEWSAEQRAELYLKGGVFSITSRILVVDMLTGKIPISLITGILLNRAETVSSFSIESYVLQLLQESNESAFIRAFSDRPQAFHTGFAPLEQALKVLCLRKALFWPRFHVAVASSLLDPALPALDTVELHVPMSPTVRLMHAALLDLIRMCLSELKSVQLRSADPDDPELALTPERFLTQPACVLLPNPSLKSKHLVADLHLLRKLMFLFLHEDAWAFLKYYETVLQSCAPTSIYSQKDSPWIYTDTAGNLLALAKTRATDPQEGMPKWTALTMVLNEIQEHLKSEANGNSKAKKAAREDEDSDKNEAAPLKRPTILLITSRPSTAYQIASYLLDGRDLTLSKAAQRYQQWKRQWKTIVPMEATIKLSVPLRNPMSATKTMDTNPGSKRRRVRHADAAASAAVEPPAPVPCKDEGEEQNAELEDELEESAWVDLPETLDHVIPEADILVRVLHGSTTMLEPGVLATLQPDYVVLYDPHPSFIRQVEVYHAQSPRIVRVYFLMLKDSLEEHLYLYQLRQEKEAFERLLKEASTLVIPLKHPTVFEGECIVDKREFRAKLPAALHARGIKCVPCTLSVGDYVIRPDLVIERKSMSDLIQSLSNGRLEQQVQHMVHYYTFAVLLVELEEAASGGFVSTYPDTASKLVLLTCHYPTLHFLWSVSPAQSAYFIQVLKHGHPQPQVDVCKRIGSSETALDENDHLEAMNLLRSLPGVEPYLHALLRRYTCMMDLICNLDSLHEVVGVHAAQEIRKVFEGGMDTALGTRSLFSQK